jgi:hypothetical protein
MGLFDFRKPKPEQNTQFQENKDSASGEKGYPEIPEKLFIETEPPKNVQSQPIPEKLTVEYNINTIYLLLDTDLQARGYDDALMNPDASHMSQNIEEIMNQLFRTINKAKTFYEDFLNEVNFHIESRSRSGMVDTVAELRMKKDVAENHMKKILGIEEDAKSSPREKYGIILSYTKGFKNGLAAISHSTILKRNF